MKNMVMNNLLVCLVILTLSCGNDFAKDKKSHTQMDFREFYSSDHTGDLIIRDRNGNLRASGTMGRRCKMDSNQLMGVCEDNVVYHGQDLQKSYTFNWKELQNLNQDTSFIIEDSRGDVQLEHIGRAYFGEAKRLVPLQDEKLVHCEIKITKLDAKSAQYIETHQYYALGIFMGETIILWKKNY